MSDTDRAKRAEARRKTASRVTALTRESWSDAGLPWPTYTRAQIPVGFVRWALLNNTRAAKRAHDLADVDALEAQRRDG